MHVEVKHGDVLAEAANVLVCSANVFLNLSGGVGGEILRRHGDAMQAALHRHLSERGLRFVQQGDVVQTDGFGTGFTQVLHAVAVDGWYRSSADVIAAVLSRAFQHAAALGARKVAVVAVGTGYGRLSIEEFGHGFRRAVGREYPPVESASVVLPTESQAIKLRAIFSEASHRDDPGSGN